jgi:hypothetical protein
MRHGIDGNHSILGNVESVTYRAGRAVKRTNPSLSARYLGASPLPTTATGCVQADLTGKTLKPWSERL